MQRFKFIGAGVARQIGSFLLNGEQVYDNEKLGIPIEQLMKKPHLVWIDPLPSGTVVPQSLPEVKPEVKPVIKEPVMVAALKKIIKGGKK